MEGIRALVDAGCCPRCVLVHSGVKDSEHYISTAAVTAATQALAAGALTGLLGECAVGKVAAATGGKDCSGASSTHVKSSSLPSESNITETTQNPDEVSNSNGVLNSTVEGSSSNCIQYNDDKHVCVSCLGLLQDACCSRETILQVCSLAVAGGYDAPTFNLSVSVPASVSLRCHLVAANYAAVTGRQPFTEKRKAIVALLKDAWKATVVETAAEILDKTHTKDGLLSVPVKSRYAQDFSECDDAMKSLEYAGRATKPQRRGRQKQYKYKNNSTATSGDVSPAPVDGGDVSLSLASSYRCPSASGDDEGASYSRVTVESVLGGCSHTELLRRCPLPASPLQPLALCPDTPSRLSVFVAGRYRKFSRELSQTPWIIGGGLKCEASVEQLIAKIVMPALGAEELKFLSSGREDVDVRCLGRGRPFALEVLDPRTAHLASSAVTGLQHRVNAATRDISVHHLQLVDRESTSALRFDTEEKNKSYCALCVLRQDEAGQPQVTEEMLRKLEGITPLTLQQQTPIRVLHRRPLLTRPRIIYSMTVTRVSHKLFKVSMETEAGTYIKEWVHGDFGRTQPSISSLLGCQVDILALDVMDVKLNWPPLVPSSEDAPTAAGREETVSANH